MALSRLITATLPFSGFRLTFTTYELALTPYSFEIVSRSTLQQILQQAYSYVRNRTLGQSLKVHPQELALLFIVFAMGARYSLESTLDEAPDLEYLPLAQACLAKGDFMAHNTLAGVQALVSGRVVALS